MTVKLSLKEKYYVVAMFGDVPAFHRARLLRMGKMPVIPAVMAAAREMMPYVERVAGPKPKGRPRGKSYEIRRN